MRSLRKVTLLLFVVVLISCDKANEPKLNNSDELIGYWINPVAVDTAWKYERANQLKENESGFSFQSGQLFLERKNAGWCGTPPITYADFDGTWAQSDSLIDITVAYWGGVAKYQWKIVSVSNDVLIISKLKEQYQSK